MSRPDVGPIYIYTPIQRVNGVLSTGVIETGLKNNGSLVSSGKPSWLVQGKIIFHITIAVCVNLESLKSCIWGRDSSVGITTGYRLEGPGIESR
jgi:hypothetical protein